MAPRRRESVGLRGIKFALVAGAVLGGLFVGGVVAGQLGAVWNGSESLPFGLYWADRGPPLPVRPGDYVVVCAPPLAARLALQRGYLGLDPRERGCAGNADPILKRVYGVAGDRYTVQAYGVSVNGAVVRNTAPLRQDDKGRPLWDGQMREATLKPHQVLALSAYNPASYDSRYFGPLDERRVLARVHPVLTTPFDGRD